MMASEPKAKEQLMMAVVVSSSAARTNCDYIDYIDNDEDDVIIHDVALHPFCENLIFKSNFGIEVRILTPYRVEFIGKTLIFGP